jgi:hypothetical protein
MTTDSFFLGNLSQPTRFPDDAAKPVGGFSKLNSMSTPDDGPNWYLQEWMAHFEKRQSALVNELGWQKARASKYWHSGHPYRRDIVNEIAGWLGIEPFELLMPPERAFAYRKLYASAEDILASGSDRFLPKATPIRVGRKTGTSG